MKKQPVVIIGSGLAGYLFAKEFRKLDTTTPLEIITANDGVFYSKPLLSTALTNKKSIAQLTIHSVNEMSSRLQARIHAYTPVEIVDPFSQTIQVRKEKITYQKLIMACGSKSMMPTLQGDAVSAVTSVNDLVTYEKFRVRIQGKKSIAILGAGLVGCEFANDLIN
ncbi:MAG: FAD-dependent oxidoreductase, partial [Coxiella endosymbiont of Haemaphysalis qinghaiensis]